MYWIVGCLALAWMAGILALGAGRFGRDGSQRMIDRFFGAHPSIWLFFDRHHGLFRAGFHYVEFFGLTLVLYLFLSRLSPRPQVPALLAAWALGSVFAYVDEWRQSRTPGRQFRRQDFVHSLFGSEIAVLAILAFYALR